MKTKLVGLLGAALAFTAPGMAAAQDSALPGTFSANVAITNDYVYRGVTQTNEDFAVQGGFDWDSGAGFYVGTWASSLEFGDDASLELDLYAGYRGEVDNFSYDIGFLYYMYPGASAPGYDFWEVYGSAGYDFGPIAANVGINFSPDFFGAANNDTSIYYSAGLSAPIGEMFSISAGVGYSALEGVKNYTDWNIGATLDIPEWFALDLRYYDSDLRSAGNFADDRFVVTISRSF